MKTVIIDAIRTPFAKLDSYYQSLSASTLSRSIISYLLQKNHLNGEDVDAVVLGTALQAGQGQNPARQAVEKELWQATTDTINQSCNSGMRAITWATQLIHTHSASVVIASGSESMSCTPYILPKARWSLKVGESNVRDSIVIDWAICPFTKSYSSTHASQFAVEHTISRTEQDEWALSSHQKAVAAIRQGKFKDEICAITDLEIDEQPYRGLSIEYLSKRLPIYDQNGSITAENSANVGDGACAVIVMSDIIAKQRELIPAATVIDTVSVSVKPQQFPTAATEAIYKLLQKSDTKLADIDLFEIHEPNAIVPLVCIKQGIPANKINVNGGTIAFGHPVAATGSRLVTSLIYELKRRGGGRGIAVTCNATGQGEAILLEV